MENTKEIKFNKDTLIKNTSVRLVYSGILTDYNPEAIYIRYCFNTNWSNYFEKELLKNDNNEYEIDIELGDNSSIDMCFKDSNNKWDNNDYSNYIFQIKEENVDLTLTPSSLPYLQKNGLRKSYLWNKKIRILLYKLFRNLPRFITGNYRRRINL